MSLNSLFRFFLPKDTKFSPLFQQMSANLIEMAKILREAVNTEDLEKRVSLFEKIEDLEHQCDHITHQVHLELGTSFITPFDREDIHTLVSKLDDIADFIHDSANRMHLYKVEKMTEPIQEMAELIIQATVEVANAVQEMRMRKSVRKVTESCVRINSIENKADYIFDKAVGQLFEYETNAIELIKYKEVLSAMEAATDSCEDVANVLESVLVKNA